MNGASLIDQKSSLGVNNPQTEDIAGMLRDLVTSKMEESGFQVEVKDSQPKALVSDLRFNNSGSIYHIA